MILEINYQWGSISNKKEDRIEIFNYKNSDDFLKFKTLSNENYELKHCFDDDIENIEESSKR